MDATGIITVLGTSVVKSLFAAAVSYGFNHTFWETVLLLAIGGCAGMTAFFTAGARLLDRLRLRAIRRRAAKAARGVAPRRVFTRTNRFIVRIKRGYGLLGLAIMPPILSIPLTALIAAKYFRHDRRTLPFLLATVAAWSVALSAAWAFLR